MIKRKNNGRDSVGRKHGMWTEYWDNGKLYLSQTYKHGEVCGLTRYRSYIGEFGSDYYQNNDKIEGEFIQYLYKDEKEIEIILNKYNI
jgi:antitoxin component YwqK of YwqJK toxin-antitoxin module